MGLKSLDVTGFKKPGRSRDYAYVSDLSDAQTVMERLPLWFKDYNENTPHKGLKMRSPKQFLSKILAS